MLERAPGLQDAPRAIVYHWATLDGLAELGLLDDAVAAGFLKQDYAYRVAATGETISYGLSALDGKVERPYNLHLGQGRWRRWCSGTWRPTRTPGCCGTTRSPAWTTAATTPSYGPRTETGRPRCARTGSSPPTVQDRPPGARWASSSRHDLARAVRGHQRAVPRRPARWAQSTFYVDPVYGAIIAKIDESGSHGLWRYTYMEDAALPAETAAERLPEFLTAVFGADVAAATELEALSPYRMHQRSATTYRRGRVLLAGDAAHATNPTGGLGLTMGIFDAFALHQALAVVHRGGDDQVLDRYADLRRRAFVEQASPRAAANKKLLFHSTDPSAGPRPGGLPAHGRRRRVRRRAAVLHQDPRDAEPARRLSEHHPTCCGPGTPGPGDPPCATTGGPPMNPLTDCWSSRSNKRSRPPSPPGSSPTSGPG